MSLGRLLYLALIGALCALGLRTFAFEGIYIATASMEPTLPVDTHAVLDKITYRFREPKRGDIISFVEPIPPNGEMVKRLIAVGGDTVELRKKKLYVNGELQDESYVRYSRAHEDLDGDSLGPITVPKRHVFVLGDNRDESNDSSMWKDPETGQPVYFVPMSKVRGLLRGFY